MQSLSNRYLLFFVLLFVIPGFCQKNAGQIKDPQTLATCRQYSSAPFPAGDRPTQDEKKRMAGCVPANLYYGNDDVPADPESARKCAYLELDKGGDHDDVFGSRAVLMMVYANGRGADLNLDLAIRLACDQLEDREGHNDFDDRYVSANMISELARLKGGEGTGRDFDVCESQWGGRPASPDCELLVRSHDKDRLLSAIEDKLRPEQKPAFQDLHNAANAFFRLDGSQGSTDVLLDAMKRFEGGSLPAFTSAQFIQADAALNAVYQEIQTQTSPLSDVHPDSIRLAQRQWLPYRDAWVAFGKLRYPGVSPDSWKTWLTNERIKTLEPLVGPSERLSSIVSKWGPEEKAAFRPLEKAAANFITAHTANEEGDHGREMLDFIEALEKLEHGALPAFTPAEFVRADAELNAAYKKARAQADERVPQYPVNADGIQEAQRTWLRYRDAWVVFGKVKYPSVTPESWKTWLTKERIAMLERLYID